MKSSSLSFMCLRGILVVVLISLLSGCGTMRTAEYVGPPLPPGMDREQYERNMRAARRKARPSLRKRVVALFKRRKPPVLVAYRGPEPEPEEELLVPRGPADVRAISSSRLSPTETTSFTVSTWIRCDQMPSQAQEFAGIIGRYSPGNSAASEWLIGVDAEGKLFLETTGSGGTPRVTAPISISTGLWHHVCAEWSPDSKATLFIDGALAKDGILEKSGSGGLPMLVGDVYPANGDYAFLGNVDEIKIWHKAATADLVASLFADAPDTDNDGVIDGNDADDDNDGIHDWWEVRFFGDQFAGDRGGDIDGDGFDNWAEYIAGSDPQDIMSVFRVVDIGTETVSSVGGGTSVETLIMVECDGLAGRTYQLWYSPTIFVPRKEWSPIGKPVECLINGPLMLSASSRDLSNVGPDQSGFFFVTVSMAE